MKTKTQIIEETANFYNSGNRAAVETENTTNTCEYLTKDGRMCAVGRCLIDPKAASQAVPGENGTTIVGIWEEI